MSPVHLFVSRSISMPISRTSPRIATGALPFCAAALLLAAEPLRAQMPTADCTELARIIGGAASAGDVCKVSLPRGDLDVTLLGASLPPPMGLTSWAAFTPTAGGGDAIVMGDLALTPEELPRVMRGLREHGLRITAVHRHMLGETPRVAFMHYMGRGAPSELARGIRSALERAPTALGRPATGAKAGEAGVVAGVRCAHTEEIFGVRPGSAATGPGLCKITVPRPDGEVTVAGTALPAAMGIASWFAFRETPDGAATVVTGDMALREAQVDPAISALAERGVDVVALHNHMTGETPRIMFFHFQARGEPEALARAFRAALDAAGGTETPAGGA